jgi:hypothetical protein
LYRKANKSIPSLEPIHIVNIISGNKDCAGIQVDGPRIWKWWKEVLILAEVTSMGEVVLLPLAFNILGLVVANI